MINTNNLLQIEYTIIGTLLYEPERVGEAVAKLAPENFSLVGTRGLFEAISALHFRGAPVEPITVQQEAGQDYDAAIREALQFSTAPSSVPYYCGLLLEYARLKQIQDEATIITAAESLKEAGEAIDRLNGLMVSRRNVEILNAADAAMDFYSRNDEHAKRPEYLIWGIGKLNKGLYAELGDLIVVGGYASAGKTLLSLQFAIELAAKYRVGYFSLETSPRKLTDRTMSHLARVPLKKIKERDFNDADWASLADASSKLSALQLDFIDAGGMTVRDIQALALNRRYQVVLVDYLQVISVRGRDRYDKVTSISQDLHTMARTNKMAVIALAQLSRPEKLNGKPKPPTMWDFKESGQIEQDADVAMLLWPSDPNDNNSRRVLKVAKNKEGERLKLDLDFDGAIQTMTEADNTRAVVSQLSAAGRRIKQANRGREREYCQTQFTELTDDDGGLPF